MNSEKGRYSEGGPGLSDHGRKIATRLGIDPQGGVLEKVLAVCKSERIQFDDPSFGPASDAPCRFRPGLPEVKWGRLTEIGGAEGRLFGKIDARTLRQGLLTGPYFLSALSCLAEQARLIKRLFGRDELSREGAYSVWVQKDGVWTEQIIDDWAPVFDNRDGISLAGSQCGEAEFWPVLLEKAYAKAWGGYDNIDGGNPLFTLRDLTGAPYSIFKDLADSETLWERLKVATSRQWLLVAIPQGAGPHRDILLPIRQLKEVSTATGNLRLIRVGDPRGQASPDLVKVSRNSGEPNTENNYWITLLDFGRLFDTLGVFMVEPDFYFEAVEVKQEESCTKSIVSFTLDVDMDLTVCLDQQDKRANLDQEIYQFSYFRLTVGKVTDDDVLFVDAKLSALKSMFLSDELPRGEYVVLVEAYWTAPVASGRPARPRGLPTFTVGLYSSVKAKVEHLQIGQGLFSRIEYLLWTNFARNNRPSFELRRSQVSKPLECKELSGFNFGVTLLAFYNDSKEQTFLLEFEQATLGLGVESIYERILPDLKRELVVPPNDCRIVLYKINPRATEFKSGYVLLKETVLGGTIRADISAINELKAFLHGNPLDFTLCTPIKPNSPFKV